MAMIASCAMSGCATADRAPVRAAPTKVVATQTEVNGDYLTTLASRIKTETPAELASDADALQKAYSARRTEDNRLRLAAFLALAPAPNGDRGKAVALLDVPPGEANGRGRTHPVAQLLLPLLQDSKRADEALSTTQQKLRDEQKRSDSLQQKLDAIRDIEKQMLERTPVPQK
ncbi:hypothetical protein ACDA63_11885 [Uliginosibacterium sp. sgz301328]|uniref:hypothetical protein n=1 Tax=Uliginosibacterium sp. sgz301328 TaxID=3243764 RepID=UPI00359CDFA3